MWGSRSKRTVALLAIATLPLRNWDCRCVSKSSRLATVIPASASNTGFTRLASFPYPSHAVWMSKCLATATGSKKVEFDTRGTIGFSRRYLCVDVHVCVLLFGGGGGDVGHQTNFRVRLGWGWAGAGFAQAVSGNGA